TTIRPRPISTLFPYTTLFRSIVFLESVRRGARSAHDRPPALELRGHERRELPRVEIARLDSLGTQPLAHDPRQFTAFVTAELKRSEEHTSELQSRPDLVCRLL